MGANISDRTPANLLHAKILIENSDQPAEAIAITPIISSLISVSPVAHLRATILAVILVAVITLFLSPVVPSPVSSVVSRV